MDRELLNAMAKRIRDQQMLDEQQSQPQELSPEDQDRAVRAQMYQDKLEEQPLNGDPSIMARPARRVFPGISGYMKPRQ